LEACTLLGKLQKFSPLLFSSLKEEEIGALRNWEGLNHFCSSRGGLDLNPTRIVITLSTKLCGSGEEGRAIEEEQS